MSLLWSHRVVLPNRAEGHDRFRASADRLAMRLPTLPMAADHRGPIGDIDSTGQEGRAAFGSRPKWPLEAKGHGWSVGAIQVRG